MNELLVSIIVPVYNVEKYVSQCVESLIKQTLKEIEIICINDGSTDSSPKILREFEKIDSRVKVIDKENTGYGDTVNIGISLARGKYIGILESDDFAVSNMYELLYGKALENDADLVKCNFYRYYAERNEDIFDEYLIGLPYDRVLSQGEQCRLLSSTPTVWAGLYKRDFLLQKNIVFLSTPGASYQDTSFAYKTALCSKRTVLVQDALIHYRNDNPNSSVKSEGKVFCVCNEFEEINRFITRNGYTKGIFPYTVAMYSSYIWNLNRLIMEKKPLFLLKMYFEFRELSFSAWLRKEYWSDAGWEAIHQLIFNFPEVYENMVERREIKEHIKSEKEAILEILNHSHPLFMYGAGQRGRRLLAVLHKYGIVLDGIVVTELARNPDTIEDVPVMDVQSIAKRAEDSLILLGVADNLKEEVLDVLRQYHISGNHLTVSGKMLRVLETDE